MAYRPDWRIKRRFIGPGGFHPRSGDVSILPDPGEDPQLSKSGGSTMTNIVSKNTVLVLHENDGARLTN